MENVLHQANAELERVQKNLADYLETKRVAFARFYFLSNDELISILSQTKDPNAVQPHLRKCFEAVHAITMRGVECEMVDMVRHNNSGHNNSIATEMHAPPAPPSPGLPHLGRCRPRRRGCRSSRRSIRRATSSTGWARSRR